MVRLVADPILRLGRRRLSIRRGGGGGSSLILPEQITGRYAHFATRLDAPVADLTPYTQWDDQSGNGRHLPQADSAKQPKLRVNDVGTIPALEFDGTNDCFQSAAAWSLSHSNVLTIGAVCRPTTSAAFRVLAELGANYGSGAGRFLLQHENNNVPSANLFGTGNVSFVHDLAWSGGLHFMIARLDMSKSRDEVLLYLDGLLATTAPASTNNAVNFAADQVLNVGARDNGASRAFLGRIHELVFWDRDLTEVEVGSLSVGWGVTYALSSYGIYTPVDPATNLADNTILTGHYSPLHRMVIDTTATRIAATATSDQNLASPSQIANAEIGVREDNADVTTWQNNLGSNVVTRHATKTLTAGSKRVELVSNAPGKDDAVTGTIYGQHLTGVWIPSDATTTFVVPDSANRAVILVDSIGLGDKLTDAVNGGWVAQIRAMFFDDPAAGNVRAMGWGSGTFYEMGNSDALLNTLRDDILADDPSIFVFCLGTNDYAFARATVLPTAWTSTAAGTALGSLWDKLYAAKPTLRRYLLTPLGRQNETTLVNGEDLPDWRTGLTNGVTGKPLTTVIDGLTILDYNGGESAKYVDGLHPNQTGQDDIADRMWLALNIGEPPPGAIQNIDSGYVRTIDGGYLVGTP